MRRLQLLLFVFTSGLVITSQSLACGESLFRIGKGVAYRAYSAPIPGTVLFYTRNDEEREIAERLREAGHLVSTVETEEELALEVQRQDLDVVVASVDLQALLISGGAGQAGHPDWVPVFEPEAQLPRSPTPDLPRGVHADDHLGKYLKAIHKNLKN